MIALTLPLGPSINHYFARSGNRTYLPAKVKEYRQQVAEIVAAEGHETLEGRLRLFAAIYPRNKRKFDLDNLCKALQDALTHAGVWLDDEQIDELVLVRREVVKNGMVKIIITNIGDQNERD